MNILCVDCDGIYNVDEKKIPDSGTKIQCPKCQNIIEVTKPSSNGAAEIDAIARNPMLKNCVACGKEVAKSAKSCPHCGKKLKMGVFSKLLIGFGIFIFLYLTYSIIFVGYLSSKMYQAVLNDVSSEESVTSDRQETFDPSPSEKNVAYEGQEVFNASVEEIDTRELRQIFKWGSDYTDLQRENKEEEITGKIVQWKCTVYEVRRGSNESYKITTKSSSNLPRTYLSVYPRNEEEIRFIESLKTGSIITIKGRIARISFRNIVIDPAFLI
jgi:predicted Zn finger-like uncharacterized protein